MKVKHKLTNEQFKRQLCQEIKKFLNHYSNNQYKITTMRHNKKEKVLMLAINSFFNYEEYDKEYQKIQQFITCKLNDRCIESIHDFSRVALNNIFQMIYDISDKDKKEIITLIIMNIKGISFNKIYHDKYVQQELPLLLELYNLFGINLNTADLITQIYCKDDFNKIMLSSSLTFKTMLNNK